MTGAVLFAMNLAFAFQLQRKPFFKIVDAIALTVLLLARHWMRPARRVSIALLILPAMLIVTAYEIYLSSRRPRSGTAASWRGETFDSRGLFEVLEDERKTQPDAVTYVIPRALLTHNLNAQRWMDEALAHTVLPNWGLEIDGVRTLPLGGVSNRRTVFCNEGGTWSIYDSDEYGYNNPRGIWDTGPIDVAILGDSYSQGACVAQKDNTASHIRKKYPKTLTFGMCANGPLMEYANLKEHLFDLKPKIVLWVFYMNDASDLNVERQSDLLLRYFREDGFRQDLRSKQAKIDAAITQYINGLAPNAPHWPAGLASLGLTRQSTPLFLQDLVMREQYSNISGLLRMDRLTTSLTDRFLAKNFFEEEVQWDLFTGILKKAKASVESWGGKMYFVYLPDVFFLKYRGARSHPQMGRVHEMVKEAGLPLIDMHDYFLKQPEPDSYRPHYEAHVNEAGFALIAKGILEQIQ